MRLLSPLLVLSVLLGWPAWAQPVADYSLYPHFDSFQTFEGGNRAIRSFELFGSEYFAVLNDNTGMSLFAPDQEMLDHLGSSGTHGFGREVVIRDWYAYVASTGGLAIYSIAVPSSPIELSYLNLAGDSVAVCVSGNQAFVANGIGGLAVVDISLPNQPTVISQIESSVTGVSCDGDRLAIIRDGRLEVYDVSTPETPVLLGGFDSPIWTGYQRVFIYGDWAYVQASGRLDRLDISDPGAIVPAPGGSLVEWAGNPPVWFDLKGEELRITISGYLGIFDVTNGNVLRESWQMGNQFGSAHGGGLLVGVAGDEFKIFKDGLTASPPTLGAIPLHQVMEPYAIVAENIFYGKSETETGVLLAGDLADWQGLEWSVDLGLIQGPCEHLERGDLIVIRQYSPPRIALVSVSQQGLQLRGSLDLVDFFSGTLKTMAFVNDQTLLVLDDHHPDQDANIRIIDVSNPDLPSEIGAYVTTDPRIESIRAMGTTILASSGAYLSRDIYLIDASDPLAMREIGLLPSNASRGQKLTGDEILYTFDYTNFNPSRFDVWDMSDLTNPLLASTLLVPGDGALVLAGDYAYQEGSGLIIDLTDPLAPVPVGNYSLMSPDSYSLATVFASREYLVAGEWHSFMPFPTFHFMPSHLSAGAVSAVEDAVPTGFQATSFPNPFNATTHIEFDLSRRAETSVLVFDVRGGQVAQLILESLPAGPHSIMWNGRDDQGRLLPSGVYFYHVQAGSDEWSGKMVMVK